MTDTLVCPAPAMHILLFSSLPFIEGHMKDTLNKNVRGSNLYITYWVRGDKYSKTDIGIHTGMHTDRNNDEEPRSTEMNVLPQLL